MVSEQQATETEDEGSQPANNTPSPGKILRERRESLGLTQQQIANKIYLKASQINDLEEDNLDSGASITFTKGYIRNYAKQLGLEAEELVATFEQFHNDVEPPTTKLQSFSRRVAKQTHDDRWMMVTYVILLLIIAGVVVWWYQQPSDEEGVEIPLLNKIRDGMVSSTPSDVNGSDIADENIQSEADTVADDSSTSDSADITENSNQSDRASEPEIDDSVDNGSVSTNNDDTSATPEDINTAQDSEISSPSTTTGLNTDATEVASVDNTEPTVGLDNSNDTNVMPISMTFTFIDDCWVNIKDATDEAIAYGIKKAGRVMEIQGIPPVEVTLGVPENVRLSVNGESVDISSYQNGRTARFTLPM